MAKQKTTIYLDPDVFTATKATALTSKRTESAVVEEALRSYFIDEGRAEAARDDLRSLLDDLRQRPDLSDLDDEAAMALAVEEVRAVRKERQQNRRPSRAAG